MPPPHTSPVVQALPSLQAFVLPAKTQFPVAGLQLSVVQTLLSLHTLGAPGLHVPPPQTSPVVQGLPSVHEPVLFAKTQPVAGSQLSVVQTLLSLQTIVVPGWHTPNPQTSPVVQALPSLHALVLLAKTHPVAGLQLSVVQALPSLQTIGAPPWHVPPPQASPVVQGFPSLHEAVLFMKAHDPVSGLQLSVVQALLSLHATAVPELQMPPPQTSPVVQALLSSQALVLLVKTQTPVTGLQLSVEQTLPSSHTVAAPGWQIPPPQVSPVVQAFMSSHGLAVFA